MDSLPTIDLGIVVAYVVAVMAVGSGFFLRRTSSDRFMAAGRSLPGWAVGLSIFGSYISSISFLANPGKAFADNWNAAVFAFAMPLAAWVAVRWFVPFFRNHGAISAYEHLETRFGAWARTYAVVSFLLTQLARLGTILFLLAVALQPLIGAEVEVIILCVGLLITIYPMLGGTEAVVWVGVVQAVILVLGLGACLAVLLSAMPDGPGQIIRIASVSGKFSLGGMDLFDWSQATFWVVFWYGLVTHLQNFGVDQSYVQRYITARGDRAATRSVWIGTALFIPVSLAFFFVGTALFAFYHVFPDRLPSSVDALAKPDSVFPHFIRHELPIGVTGLVIAAICAAAMDSNLNNCATLVLCDLYRRYLRPRANDRESLRVLRLSTLVMGVASIAAALAMTRVRTALDAWWELAGIFSGGLFGLFLLGMVSRQAHRGAAIAGVVAAVLAIGWLTFSRNGSFLPDYLRSPFHPLLTIVIGTLTVIVIGGLAPVLLGRSPGAAAARNK
jgi:SSS family solute:Na+ symporter